MDVTTLECSLLPVVSMTQAANVTGRKLTSARTMFTIVVFARAKEFGDFGNCRAIRGVFTFGRSAKRKANRSTKARKSQRHWKQLRRRPVHEPLRKAHLVKRWVAGATS